MRNKTTISSLGLVGRSSDMLAQWKTEWGRNRVCRTFLETTSIGSAPWPLSGVISLRLLLATSSRCSWRSLRVCSPRLRRAASAGVDGPRRRSNLLARTLSSGRTANIFSASSQGVEAVFDVGEEETEDFNQTVGETRMKKKKKSSEEQSGPTNKEKGRCPQKKNGRTIALLNLTPHVRTWKRKCCLG